MYYFGFAPHFSMKKLFLEGFNEVMIIMMSYHMFCFTFFVPDVEVQYNVGYSFVIFFLVITLANLVYMVNNVYIRCRSKSRKKRYQKAYEARFLEF